MTADRYDSATTVTFNLPQRLDALTADDLYTAVHKILKQGTRRLTLDAGAMTYISSKGIRALMRIREELRQNGGAIILENLRAFAQEVLTASGLGGDLTGRVGEAERVCG